MDEYKNGCSRNCTIKTLKTILNDLDSYNNITDSKFQLYELMHNNLLAVITRLEDKNGNKK